MHVLVVVTGYLTYLTYGVLAVVAWRHWRRSRAAGSSWVAATFTGLAVVAVCGAMLPQDTDPGGPMLWVGKALLVLLALFPYFLYRFSATFEAPGSLVDRGAAAITGVLVAATVALPRIPGDDTRPAWFGIYIAAFLLQWTALSTTAALLLWRAGREQPTVARRRMQVLSVGSVLLNLTLVLAGTASSGDRDTATKVVVNVLASGSALLFLAGFGPPRGVRRAWRRPEEEVLKAAQLDLMAATTPAEVTDHLLRPVAGVLGGRGAALVDRRGDLVGAYGVGPADVEAAASDAGGPDAGAPVRLTLECGALLVWTTPKTPFFGQDELDVLGAFGVVTDLAMARCRLVEDQRQREQRLSEAQRVARLGSWEWDVVADRLSWSDELYRMFGVSPDELDPTYGGYLARVHPDDRPRVDGLVGAALQGTDYGDTEHRIVRSSGEVAWVRVRREVVLDDAGAPVLMRGTLHDITDARRMEAELEETGARYRLLQVMAVAANEAEEVDDALRVAVSEICAHTGWVAGHVWQASADGPCLAARPIWHIGPGAPAGMASVRALLESGSTLGRASCSRPIRRGPPAPLRRRGSSASAAPSPSRCWGATGSPASWSSSPPRRSSPTRACSTPSPRWAPSSAGSWSARRRWRSWRRRATRRWHRPG